MQQYVIIGAGAAGAAAAEAIRSRDEQGKILLVSEEPEGYYSRPGLAYVLTGELTEKQLFPFSPQDFRRLNIQPVYGRAVMIDRAGRQVLLQDGRHLDFDRLLIATGSQAARVDMPNMDAEGVVKLDNIADARRILALARKARYAVIVGGGITALEIVEGLSARGIKPDYFLRGDRYWSNVLDETESRIVEHKLKEEGVRIHYHTELAEVLTRKGRVSAIRTKDGRDLKCDLLAVAIGVKPRVELARTSGLRVDKGIWVDETLQTSEPGIYAAGDAAEAFDPFTGRTQLNTLWPLARDQGRIAGLNMAAGDRKNGNGSGHTPYCNAIPFNVTRLGGLTTTIIGTVGRGRDEDLVGIARGDSETWRQLPDAIAAQANFDVNRLRVLVSQQKLIGAVVMGDQTLSRPLQILIDRQIDISPISEQLLQPDAPVADILAEFWCQTRGCL
jgi:NADPH-dependent 2,4-dienoyl-CoA reductase/sulfur reductase-like enzyme